MYRRVTLSLRILWAAVALLTAALVFPAPASGDGEVEYVRVLLSTQDAGKLTVPVKGTYLVVEANRTFTDGTLTISANGDAVTLAHSAEGELFSGKKVTVQRTVLSREGGYLTMDVVSGRRAFLGHFSITAAGGVLKVVNRVPMSHYLYGVVAYEMSDDFPIEALKAQAVTAKGYALLSAKGSGSYDLVDTASDQVYKGYDPTKQNVMNAVDMTASDVLYYNGAPLQCYYAASNGGWMILPGTRWSSKEFDGAYAAGADPYDMANPFTPRETMFISANYSERAMGTRAFNFLDARISALVAAPGFIPDQFRFGAVQSVDSVSSSGSAGYKGDLNHTTVTLEATVRADRDKSTLPTPTPVHAPTPSPTPVPELPTPTPAVETPSPTPVPSAPQPGEPGYETYVSPSPTPAPELPTPTPGWETPSPTPAWEPTPSPTPAPELTKLLPLNLTFSFEDLFTAGIFTTASKLSVTYGEIAPGGFNLQHARYGHGVGMSQRGAQQMALLGKSYREILQFYYPGATLGTLSFVNPETVSVPSAPSAVAETKASGGTVVNSTVNLRQSASRSSASLEQLSVGTNLSLLGMTGDWYFVQTPSGKQGYVRYDYVMLTGSAMIAAGVVSSSAVNYRTGPGTDYEAIARLSKGTSLGIYGMEQGWYKVKAMTTGLDGFIKGDYVSVTQQVAGDLSAASVSATPTPIPPTPTPIQIGGSTPAPTPTPKPAPAVTATPVPVYAVSGTMTGSRVNLREGASTSTRSIGKLNRGDRVGVYEKTGGWYRVKTMETGQEGYVYAKYVALNTQTQPVGGDTAANSKGYINASGVSLREGSSTAYSRIARLSKNTTVKLLGTAGSWYKVQVSAGGAIGYVFNKYVTITGINTSDSAYGVVSGRLNLRTAPSTGPGSSVLTVMPRGAVVAVETTANGWCYVSYQGQKGYCSQAYVRIG